MRNQTCKQLRKEAKKETIGMSETITRKLYQAKKRKYKKLILNQLHA